MPRLQRHARAGLTVGLFAVSTLLAVSLVWGHCKQPPPIPISPRDTLNPDGDQVVPWGWTWVHWWEANRDPYLEQMQQAHRFQNADAAFLEDVQADATGLLTEALEHEKAVVRRDAAVAVARLGHVAMVTKLRELASEDEREAVRLHALLALGAIGGDEVEAFLAEQTYPTLTLRLAGLQALGLLEELSGSTVDRLKEVARRGATGSDHERAAMAVAATWALRQHAASDDPAFFRQLVQQTPSPWVAAEAILALSAGDQASHELLADIVQQTERGQAMASWQLLEDVHGLKKAIQERLDARHPLDPTRPQTELTGPGAQIAYRKAHAILARQDPNPPLEAEVHERQLRRRTLGLELTWMARLRASAAIALGEVDHAGSTTALLELMDERANAYNVLPKRFALIALGRLGDERALPVLLAEADRFTERGHLKGKEERASALRGFAALGLGLYARSTAPGADEPRDRPGFEQAMNLLAERLADGDESAEVRSAVAVGLGLTQRTAALRALTPVMRQLHEHEDDLLIGFVMLGRGMVGDRMLAEPASRYLELEHHPHTIEEEMGRRAGVLGLGLSGATEAIPTLVIAWDLSYHVSREVVRALVMCEAQNVAELAIGHYREPENHFEEAYMALVLGELLAPEWPAAWSPLTIGANFTVPNTTLQPFHLLASEFLYHEMIPALQDAQP